MAFARAANLQRDGRTRFAAHELDGFAQAFVFHRFAVDAQNDVSALQTGFGRRGVIDGRNDRDESVDVAARNNDLLVRTPRGVIYSRLVEGRYPNWRQGFPQRENAVEIDMTVGPLYSALRQAAIVTDHDSRGIDFTFADGTLKMEANTAEIGESQIELPIAYDGEPITLTLDHRYVADFCKVLDNELTFVMEIESASSPALLLTDDGYGYVIMPMARDR